MAIARQPRKSKSGLSVSATVLLALAFVFVLTTVASPAAHAQTYQVIHNFTGGGDGSTPNFGVLVDHGGNLYGTTYYGGDLHCIGGPAGCGVVFKLSHRASGWLLASLYNFELGNDGSAGDWLTFGPDGTLYGATTNGGGSNNCSGGCGTIFNLRPKASVCRSVLCYWQETQLHSFSGPDGIDPSSLVFDSHGNILGVAPMGGANNQGVVFELTHSGGGWNFQMLYSFTGGLDGGFPIGPLVVDTLGNLYGTASFRGSNGGGTIFELSPSASGWTETTLWAFGTQGTGTQPVSGLIVDSSGNLYGVTTMDLLGGPGVVFELSSSVSGWVYQELYDLPGSGSNGAANGAPLAMDSVGNLYGTTQGGSGLGTVYKLTPSSGGWQYTLLHQFGGSDGWNPSCGVSFDASGNLYGTTALGGADGAGVVWEITP